MQFQAEKLDRVLSDCGASAQYDDRRLDGVAVFTRRVGRSGGREDEVGRGSNGAGGEVDEGEGCSFRPGEVRGLEREGGAGDVNDGDLRESTAGRVGELETREEKVGKVRGEEEERERTGACVTPITSEPTGNFLTAEPLPRTTPAKSHLQL